jgi:hypothetical protein
MAELVNVDAMRSIVSHLSSFDNRYTGTLGSFLAISYIGGFFKLNCSIQNVFHDNFTFNDQGVLVEASTIIAKISAAKQTNRTILVSAHHDSIGYQYPFNIYSTGAKGADDDASGVGALLETARIISLFKEYLIYNVLFIVFAAEEGNKTLSPDFMCQGSTHWVSTGHPGVAALSDIVAALDVDGVAYNNGGPVGIYYHGSGSSIACNLSSVASQLNIPAKDEEGPRHDSYLTGIRCRTEDTFDKARIPAVTLSNHYTNPFTHTNLDTLSCLDFNLACNFTRVLISYIYLTGGSLPNPEVTYTESWRTSINHSGQFDLNESNYIAVNFNPNIINGFDLIILDPSISGITTDHLLQTISACSKQGMKLPVVSLGKTAVTLLRALNLSGAECIGGTSTNNDLVAYLGNSITDLSSHPIYNQPNIISLTPENSTHLSYVVLRQQPRDNAYYLIRNNANTCRQLLPLSCTPFPSELWSWLAVLHDNESSFGPVALIGVDNGSSITDVAKGIVDNTVWWLVNGSRNYVAVRLSCRNPLVGDPIKVAVAVRDSLTWEAASSIPISIDVRSPSGGLLLGEICITDQKGVVESSSQLIREIGGHEVTVTANLGVAGVTRTVTMFNSLPRITIEYQNDRINVTQGESIRVMLNLTYLPTQSEDLILELAGRPLLSNVSIVETLRHGCNNITFTMTSKETIQVGEYDLTFAAMPRTMEYIACNQLIKIVITPAYEVGIIEAPNTVEQLSSVQLIVQIKSYRSIPISCSLRTNSYGIMLTGEAYIVIASGETKQVKLSAQETSSSPYAWGGGKIRVAVIRNGVVVVESPPVAVFVSLSVMNLTIGYVLPVALPIAIFIEQSKRKKVQLTAPGTFLGGYAFFAIGLAIYQSFFMLVPLCMLIAGCYVGTMLMVRVYDMPLPKGYGWFIPWQTYGATGDHDKEYILREKLYPPSTLPDSCSMGIRRLKDLYNMKKYQEVVPAAYILVVGMLSDLMASSRDSAYIGIEKAGKLKRVYKNNETLTELIKQLKQQHISVPSEALLRRLLRLHQEYAKQFSSAPSGDLSQVRARRMAGESIEIVESLFVRDKVEAEASKCKQK